MTAIVWPLAEPQRLQMGIGALLGRVVVTAQDTAQDRVVTIYFLVTILQTMCKLPGPPPPPPPLGSV